MKDSVTLAYVNFYAAMGTLEAYCKYDKEASALAAQKNIAIRFKVKGGPDGVLAFKDGQVTAVPYQPGIKFDIGLSCNSPEDFNTLVAGGKVTPLPFKGFTKLGFVLNKESPFNVLTDKMGKLMRQTEFNSAEEKRLATILTFNAMGAAIAEIGNHDEIGKVANEGWPEGEVSMEIPNECNICITRKSDGKLYFKRSASERPRAAFVFSDIDVAKGVIDGKLDAMTCIGTGGIAMKGMGWMLDRLNKCLNLVPMYLA